MKKTLLLAMTIFYPQRAVGTHRAEGTSLLPKAKTSYHRFYKNARIKLKAYVKHIRAEGCIVFINCIWR